MANSSIKTDKTQSPPLPPPGPAWSSDDRPGVWHPVTPNLPPPGPTVEPPPLPEGWTEPVDWTEGLHLTWCIECGNDILPNSNGRPKKFCSGKCKVSYHRAKMEWSAKLIRIQNLADSEDEIKRLYHKAGLTTSQQHLLRTIVRKAGPAGRELAALTFHEFVIANRKERGYLE